MTALPDTCPCGPPVHPRVLHTPAGLARIDYRIGDFATFRHALLQALPGETQLTAWRADGEGDLALQMAEWWAYLADILTFYNERIAEQSYLRTADLPESVRALIRLLGYRPRPGLAAHGTLAALLDGRGPVSVPKGFQVQSKAAFGKPAQVFEVSADTTLTGPDAVVFDPPPPSDDLHKAPSVLLAGTITALRRGAQALLLEAGWDGSNDHYDVVEVAEVSFEKGPRRAPLTRITFTRTLELPPAAASAGYRILYGARSAGLWQLGGFTAVTASTLDLENVVRQVHAGDPILLATSGADPADRALLSVTGYQELVWYANASAGSPSTPPANAPLPILHSELTFASPSALDATRWQSRVAQVAVLYGWREAGSLVPSPATELPAQPVTVTAVSPATFPPPPADATSYPLLVEAAAGGESAVGSPAGDPSSLQLQAPTEVEGSLGTPVRALLALLEVTRGESVPAERLGSGDASQAGQEFVLRKSPLTYLFDPSSSSGADYRSSLRVWVDGIEWTEAASFFGQPPQATVFVTREDDSGKTHVVFGDGVNGARLPTGAGNVTASYRIGSGATAPDASSLITVVNPLPGLKAIRNPVAVGGGSDADPPERIRQYAPRSVLTFGRAVSALDYETIAALAPGVARARAYWSWDAAEQRNLVKVYVGDDQAALTSAQLALTGAEDPNRPISVLPAQAISDPDVVVRVAMLPGRRESDVRAAVTAALLDDQAGLFGAARTRIGELLFESQIVAACMSAAGVAGVHLVEFSTGVASSVPGVLWNPGEGCFFKPDPGNLWVDVVAP